MPQEDGEILSGVFEIRARIPVDLVWDEAMGVSDHEGAQDVDYVYEYTQGAPPLTSFTDADLFVRIYTSATDAESNMNWLTSGQFFDNIFIVDRSEDSVTVRVRYSQIDVEEDTRLYLVLFANQPSP